MQTAKVTWFGAEGRLNLQMRRFPAGKEVKCRLDDILLPERKRYRDQLLVRRCDGALINVGALVPEREVLAALRENSVVDDGHTGFFVHLPRGHGLVDNKMTNELNVVPAGEIPALTESVPEPAAVAVKVHASEEDKEQGIMHVEIGDSEPDMDTDIIHGEEAKVAAEASKRAMKKKLEEDAEEDEDEVAEESAKEGEAAAAEAAEEDEGGDNKGDDLLDDLMGD